MKSVYVPLFLTFFFRQQFLTFPFSVCGINNKTISMQRLHVFKSSIFVCLLYLFFSSPCYPVYKSTLSLLLLLLTLPLSLLSILLSLKNLTLSSLLPLLLVLLFFLILLMLLYLFAIVSFSQY